MAIVGLIVMNGYKKSHSNQTSNLKSDSMIPTPLTVPMNVSTQEESNPLIPTSSTLPINVSIQEESTPQILTSSTVPMNVSTQEESSPMNPSSSTVPINVSTQDEKTFSFCDWEFIKALLSSVVLQILVILCRDVRIFIIIIINNHVGATAL
jgi:hypothetical protein